MRVRPSKRFLRALARLVPADRERALRALEKLADTPESRGLNFEPVKGEPDHFTIRAGLRYRVLIRKDHGPIYTALDVDTHEIYRRR